MAICDPRLPLSMADVPVAEHLLEAAGRPGPDDPVMQFVYLWMAYNAVYCHFYSRILGEWCADSKAHTLVKRGPTDRLRKLLEMEEVSAINERTPRWETGQPLVGAHGILDLQNSRYPHKTEVVHIEPGVLKSARRGDPRSIELAAGDLARMVYTVRCSLFHGQKWVDLDHSRELIAQCCPIVRQFVAVVTD